MKKSTHLIEEIPTEIRTREFFPLQKNVLKLIKKLGWEKFNQQRETILEGNFIYELLRERLTESILTAKAVIEGTLEKPWRILTYNLFPPIVAIRSDVQQGTMKLIFGYDVDTTFIIADDINSEILFLLNCGLQDGIPYDWYFIDSNDDVLDRRHLKYGVKLRDMVKKSKKGIVDSSLKMIDILKDIRNERTPNRMQSTYHVATCWLSAAFNQAFDLSNYEAYGGFYDGVASQSVYKLSDYLFCFVPWPPIMKSLLYAGRRGFMKKWASWCGNKLLINQWEDSIINWVKEKNPETFNIIFNEGIENIPFPCDSLLSKNILIENHKKTGFFFSENNLPTINIKDLVTTEEEWFKGLYLRVTPRTPNKTKIDESFIISKGMGKNTQILQD
ncbi:MAG: hypothetical protein EAX96_08705 [Candidatus Lokiarchaeota archaeon]|nr:hypothetical protein [Candidatus Lokiarchaeota archaeon]